ncbi:MAG TPA: right-handed parallel beta-helix repeat-containing protein, partial [Acidimicrobiales bacterium]|nr:right-handed parallel beta-helix repeat-containing protein [Acidimicrobiales bacterium]
MAGLTLSLLVGVLAVAPPAVAATLVASSLLDEPDANPGDGVCASTPSGVCTLRAAIEEANATPGADTVTVPVGTYVIGTPLVVTDDLVLEGSGPDQSVVVTQPTFTSVGGLDVIRQVGGSLEVRSLGFDLGARQPTGIRMAADGLSLRVEDVVMDGASDGVGVFSAIPGPGDPSDITVDVLDSVFRNHGNVPILVSARDIFVDGSRVATGLRNTVRVLRTSFEANEYALLFDGDATTTVTITDSQIVDGYLLDGAGTAVRRANGIEMYGEASLRIERTLIARNEGGISGSGPVEIIDSELRDNSLYGFEGLGVTILGSTIDGNGYGIGATSLVMRDSTVSDSAPNENCTRCGVGVRVYDDPATVTNSTISGNARFGLGLFGGGDVDGVTIVGNAWSPDSEGDEGSGEGGLYIETSGVTSSVRNTVLAGNRFDCFGLPAGSPFPSAGHNLDSDGTCGLTGPGDRSGIDP